MALERTAASQASEESSQGKIPRKHLSVLGPGLPAAKHSELVPTCFLGGLEAVT